jgi:hypothetical protein
LKGHSPNKQIIWEIIYLSKFCTSKKVSYNLKDNLGCYYGHLSKAVYFSTK